MFLFSTDSKIDCHPLYTSMQYKHIKNKIGYNIDYRLIDSYLTVKNNIKMKQKCFTLFSSNNIKKNMLCSL